MKKKIISTTLIAMMMTSCAEYRGSFGVEYKGVKVTYTPPIQSGKQTVEIQK